MDPARDRPGRRGRSRRHAEPARTRCKWQVPTEQRFRRVVHGRVRAGRRARTRSTSTVEGSTRPGVLVRLPCRRALSRVGRALLPRQRRGTIAASSLGMASCRVRSSSAGLFTAYRGWREDPRSSCCTSATTGRSTRRALRRARRERAPPRGTGDRDAGGLPAAARAVPDRPGPAGPTRRGALAGRLRRPRGGRQLGRRDAGEARANPDFLQRRGGRVPGVLREHAAAPRLDPARHRHAALPPDRWGGWRPSTCWTPGSTATTRDAATGTRTARPPGDPARSITGAAAGEWLLDGFRRSNARWDVLGQQVFFAQRDNDADPPRSASMDAWDGYGPPGSASPEAGSTRGVRNPVVLTGDVHAHWASELKPDYDDPTLARRSAWSSSAARSAAAATAPTRRPRPSPVFAMEPAPAVPQAPARVRRRHGRPRDARRGLRCIPRRCGSPTRGLRPAAFAVADRQPGLHRIAAHPQRLRLAHRVRRRYVPRTSLAAYYSARLVGVLGPGPKNPRSPSPLVRGRRERAGAARTGTPLVHGDEHLRVVHRTHGCRDRAGSAEQLRQVSSSGRTNRSAICSRYQQRLALEHRRVQYAKSRGVETVDARLDRRRSSRTGSRPISPASRRRSTSARPRRARSCGSPGAPLRRSAGRVLRRDESQQPTCPQSRHSRRCTQVPPSRRHSSQPSGVSGSTLIGGCSQVLAAARRMGPQVLRLGRRRRRPPPGPGSTPRRRARQRPLQHLVGDQAGVAGLEDCRRSASSITIRSRRRPRSASRVVSGRRAAPTRPAARSSPRCRSRSTTSGGSSASMISSSSAIGRRCAHCSTAASCSGSSAGSGPGSPAGAPATAA